MRISKREIERLIEDLQDIVAVMEEQQKEEIETSCNTYRMTNFISFGRNGYLNLENAIDKLYEEEE